MSALVKFFIPHHVEVQPTPCGGWEPHPSPMTTWHFKLCLLAASLARKWLRTRQKSTEQSMRFRLSVLKFTLLAMVDVALLTKPWGRSIFWGKVTQRSPKESSIVIHWSTLLISNEIYFLYKTNSKSQKSAETCGIARPLCQWYSTEGETPVRERPHTLQTFSRFSGIVDFELWASRLRGVERTRWPVAIRL